MFSYKMFVVREEMLPACTGPGNLNMKSRTGYLSSIGEMEVGMWRETVYIHCVDENLRMSW